MNNKEKITKRAVALGYFDGLHIGHREVLLNTLAQRKNGLTPAVMLFDMPPYEAVTGKRVPRLMTDLKRDEILANAGFELLYVSFEKIKNLSPEAFVRDILCTEYNAGAVFCGFNYTFGKCGAGDAVILRRECDKLGIDVHVSGCVRLGDTAVSSSAIRKAVENGDMEHATEMLGCFFGFSSAVFSGDHRGRLLGAPTINQYLPDGLVTPKFGVYASLVDIEGSLLSGVTNIGRRPTFDGESLRSETFILGFNGDLYGQTISVYLVSFIRNEMKFPSAQALKEQIKSDERKASEITSVCDKRKIHADFFPG